MKASLPAFGGRTAHRFSQSERRSVKANGSPARAVAVSRAMESRVRVQCTMALLGTPHPIVPEARWGGPGRPADLLVDLRPGARDRPRRGRALPLVVGLAGRSGAISSFTGAPAGAPTG